MIFRTLAIIISLITANTVSAQYYYQDIIVGRQSGQQYQLLKQNKVRKVVVSSFEPDDTPTPNFSLSQQLDAQKQQLITWSQTDFTGKSVLTTQYNANGQATYMIDSTNTVMVKTSYAYDAAGRLTEVRSFSYDEGQLYVAEEDHIFTWDARGYPAGMLRIKSPADTLRVVFIPSENGQPGEEQWWKGNKKTETWYYYYDDAGRLTDIVRFSARAQKMLPDYLFEYDENGRLEKQTTVLAGSSDYRVWYYAYDERGLKTGELILDKQQKPLGRTVYEYQ